MTFLVAMATVHQRAGPGDVADRLAERLGAVEHEQLLLAQAQPTVDQIGEQRGRDRRVLRRALPQRQRHLRAIDRDPERDDVRHPGQLDPVDHHDRQLEIAQIATQQLIQRRPRAAHERARDRRLAGRACLPLDLRADRLGDAPRPAGRNAGEHPLKHDPLEQIAAAEQRVGLKADLAPIVGGPHARAADRDPPAAERHLTADMTVALRRPLAIMAALRPDDLVDLVLHALMQHGEPGTDGERHQPLLR